VCIGYEIIAFGMEAENACLTTVEHDPVALPKLHIERDSPIANSHVQGLSKSTKELVWSE